MKYLLDTHTLAWWLSNDQRLSRKVFALIANTDNEIVASAVAAWEAANKFRIGKWSEAQELATNFKAVVTAERFSILDITHQHASVGGLLHGAHRDPFDRLLAAQALVDRMPILSGDKVFESFGVEAIW